MLLTALLLQQGLAAAGEIMLVSPRGHTAEELAATLQPLLHEDESISTLGGQLLIRASANRQAELQQLLQQIDTVPRQLRITVSQHRQQQDSSRQLAVGGRVQAGDVTLGAGIPARSNVMVQEGNNVIVGRAEDNQRQQNSSDTQVLTVMEGYPALIQTGESRPVPQQTVIRQGDRITVVDSQSYVSADTGMRVIPHVQGNWVVLQLAPQQASFTSGSSNSRQFTQANTTVRGRLGEWIELGGINQSSDSSHSGLLESAQGQQNQTGSIWVKVDLIQP